MGELYVQVSFERLKGVRRSVHGRYAAHGFRHLGERYAWQAVFSVERGKVRRKVGIDIGINNAYCLAGSADAASVYGCVFNALKIRDTARAQVTRTWGRPHHIIYTALRIGEPRRC